MKKSHDALFDPPQPGPQIKLKCLDSAQPVPRLTRGTRGLQVGPRITSTRASHPVREVVFIQRSFRRRGLLLLT